LKQQSLAKRKDHPSGWFFLLVYKWFETERPRGESGAALPGADAAATLSLQRSKKRRNSVSPKGFSGTAKRIKSLLSLLLRQ